MSSSIAQEQDIAPSHTNATLIIASCLLVVIGLIWSDSLEQLLAYFLIVFAAILPSWLWIRMGALGIPVFPGLAAAYIPTCAFPILGGNESLSLFTLSDILRSAATVALFLVTGTIVWRLIANLVREGTAVPAGKFNASGMLGLAYAGLAIGLLFHISANAGWLAVVGAYFGVVRSVAGTIVTLACFLFGIARACGYLRGGYFWVAIAGVVLLVVLTWSSLFLVAGIIYALAALFGYSIVSRRVFWLPVIVLFTTTAILHAGKAEMRDKYWEPGTNSGAPSSLAQLPDLASEWISAGIGAIARGDINQNVIDRASILQMIVQAQTETPDRVDYLNGETYSYIPAVLVPRFVDADKPTSQVAMNLLNIRYGNLTDEGVASTAIGWGLIAEAFANFGYAGVVLIALIVGACCGGLAVWSSGAELISLPTLISIAVMMTLINLETDSVGLVSTLLQSLISVVVFLAAYRALAISRESAVSSEAVAL